VSGIIQNLLNQPFQSQVLIKEIYYPISNGALPFRIGHVTYNNQPGKPKCHTLPINVNNLCSNIPNLFIAIPIGLGALLLKIPGKFLKNSGKILAMC